MASEEPAPRMLRAEPRLEVVAVSFHADYIDRVLAAVELAIQGDPRDLEDLNMGELATAKNQLASLIALTYQLGRAHQLRFVPREPEKESPL